MKDSYQREITYLRLSVTDLCNLRCRYCMPAEGVVKKQHSEICSVEELVEMAAAAADCGVTKVRLTGGEPLVRRGILEICRGIRALPGVRELCLTTNGTLLPELAAPLREAGVDRLNVSLDTLRPDRYAYMTRRGELSRVLQGLEAEASVARAAGKAEEAPPEELQVSLAQQQEEKALRQLKQADLDSMTPRDALDFLYELKKLML